MNTQIYSNLIDDSGYDWLMEARKGARYRSWLPSNPTDSTKSAGCTNDNNCSNNDGSNDNGSDNNGSDDNGSDDNGSDDNGSDDNSSDDNGSDDNRSDDNGSMQGEAESVTSLPSDTPSALDAKQATMEGTPSHTSTKAWHMATHTNLKGEEPSCRILGPVEIHQPDKITLEVSLDATEKHYTITPYFPAKHESDAPRWANSAIVSDALAQINTIITEIDPSVCFNVKTKALESHDRETRVGWHVKALNTLLARSPNRVTIALREYPVTFGQASGETSIVPNAYYPERDNVIKSKRRHVLQRDQAERLFSQLPSNHPCYRTLKPKGTARK